MLAFEYRWPAAVNRTSKWVPLIVGTLLLQNVQAQVTLPFYEPFAYPIAQNLGTNDSAAVWTLGDTTGSGSPAIYPIDNLSYPGLVTTSNSSGVIVGLAGKSRDRGILLPTVHSGSIYASFLLNVQSAPTGNSLFAALSSVTEGDSPGSSANGVWLNSSGQLMISVDSTSTPSTGNTAALTTNVTHLVVASYNPTGKTMSLWLDPATNTFGAAEGSLPAASISTVNSSGKTNVSSYYFLHDTNDWVGFNGLFDELRLGTTWASVTPAAAPVTLAATQLAFTTQPGYAATGASIGTVTVQVLDQNGNAFADGGVPVTLSLIGSGTLGGTVTQNTDGTGKATFSNLTVNTAGVDQLSASGGGLPAGTSDYFSILATGGGGSTPVITHAFLSGGNVVLGGSNGTANQSFNVLASSSLATPRSSWATVGTASFLGDGTFNCTNPISGAQEFFSLAYSGGGGSLPTFAVMGFANATNTTGGAGGPTVTVTDYSDFTNYLNYPAPLIIRVAGTITDPVAGTVTNDYAYIEGELHADNKTILGVGTNATLVGVDLRLHATNIIVRNLSFIVPPGTNDAITIDSGTDGTNKYAWIDHCDFYNTQDGAVDITKGVDYITLSWNRFHYSITDNPAPWHRLTDLIGASDTDSGVNFHVTFHHDWYDTNCMERMPSVRFGRVHVFNNYFACPGNDYCVRTRLYAQVLVQNTYFNGVNDAVEQYINNDTSTEPTNEHGLLNQSGNIFNDCTTNYGYILLTDSNHLSPGQPPCGFISSNAASITFTQNGSGNFTIVNMGIGNDTLSDLDPPPYAYTLDPVAGVPGTVTNYAGAGKILPLP